MIKCASNIASENECFTRYPNLAEMLEYHPYSDCTVCDHARIEPELLDAVLNEGEVLEFSEILGIARLYECPMGVLEHGKVIMLDMGRWRHRNMVAEISSLHIQLHCMAEEGNQEAEKYLEQADEAVQRFIKAAYDNRLSYCHYFGVKERIGQYIFFARPKEKKRGLASRKGGAA